MATETVSEHEKTRSELAAHLEAACTELRNGSEPKTMKSVGYNREGVPVTTWEVSLGQFRMATFVVVEAIPPAAKTEDPEGGNE